MKRERLADLAAFVTVAREPSFTRTGLRPLTYGACGRPLRAASSTLAATRPIAPATTKAAT